MAEVTTRPPHTLLALAAGLATAGLAACDRGPALPVHAADDPPWFEDVAAARGIDFRHESGHDGARYLLPECVSGGGALFDLEGDGDLDVYLVQGGPVEGDAASRPPNRLYRNDGGATFVDVTEGSGAGHRGYGMGVACGDYDDDGDVDLYVTNLGANVLLRNEGGGRFEDVTDAAGVGDARFGASATFVDYDHDGDLDLYVCNYVDWTAEAELICTNWQGSPDYCPPSDYDAPGRDVLYRNDGGGVFTDVSVAAGIAGAPGTGLGVVCGDFTGDGLVDIFVANDGMEDRLWANRGDGTFVDAAPRLGCAYDSGGKVKAGMGVTADDIDGDGDLDLLVCNLGGESDSFFLNEGGAFMADMTAAVGLGAAGRAYTRFGVGWADFDNDGRRDLYEANGRIERKGHAFASDRYAEPNLLLRGVGAADAGASRPGPRFEVVAPGGGVRPPLVATSRAAAFGDIDGDGGVDILVVNRDGPVHLLRNVVPGRGHWLALRVLTAGGRDALGATVIATMGDRRVTRDVRAGYSYLASSDPRVHLGLGEATRVDDVTVRWVDGTRESFGGFGADRAVSVRRGQGSPVHDRRDD